MGKNNWFKNIVTILLIIGVSLKIECQAAEGEDDLTSKITGNSKCIFYPVINLKILYLIIINLNCARPRIGFLEVSPTESILLPFLSKERALEKICCRRSNWE